ncbi:MAG TPA: CPBP family intramembrane glutamic endopeptidase [Vicinamibacterales bacterium]|nr:CPBP family intramembrane glutamic endopeptidase [Vicinamibacterales bacterium]
MSDSLAPSAPPRDGATSAQQRVVALLEILLCSSVPTQLALGYLLTLGGFSPTTADGSLSLPYVLTLSLADTLLLIVLMVTLMHAHGEDATSLWIGQTSVRREALIGVALIPAVFLLVVVLLNALRLLFPGLHNVATNPLEALAGNSAEDAALFGLLAIIAGGVREELQRAFVLHRFEQHLGGGAVGVIVWNTAFGLGHYVQGWDAVITTGVLGAVWGLLFLDRRSSVAPVVSHAGFNSLEILRVVLGPR